MLADEEWEKRRLAREEAKKKKAQQYYQANKEKIKARVKAYKATNKERYRKLGRAWMAKQRATNEELRAKERARRKKDWAQNKDKRYAAYKAWCAKNPDYMNKWMAEKRRKDPIHYLLAGAKVRAKKLGLPFSITRQDVPLPRFCPVLNIEIQYGGGKGFNPTSPSIDRIVPALGYVPGNVCVISYRANELKKDATPEELAQVAAWAARETERVRRELG